MNGSYIVRSKVVRILAQNHEHVIKLYNVGSVILKSFMEQIICNLNATCVAHKNYFVESINQ